MHRDVDLARREGDVELLGEKPLAAGLAERAVGDEIAARLDDDGLDPATGRAMRGGEPGRDLARLGQREGTSARAEPRGRSGVVGWIGARNRTISYVRSLFIG
jgi:hypothetical protein